MMFHQAALILSLLAGVAFSFRSPSPKAWNHHRLYQMGGLAEKLGGIIEVIAGQSKITEANIEATLDEVKTILLDADVNLQVTNALISKVKEKAIGMKVEAGQKPGEQFISLLAAELVEIMGKAQVPLTRRTDGRPNIILMCGLQGAGIALATLIALRIVLHSRYRKDNCLCQARLMGSQAELRQETSSRCRRRVSTSSHRAIADPRSQSRSDRLH